MNVTPAEVYSNVQHIALEQFTHFFQYQINMFNISFRV